MSYYGNCVYRDLPRSKDQLPLQTVRLAVSLFAATETGMTGQKIFDFFARYSTEIAKMRYGSGAPTKRAMFENFIESLPADTQRRALLELCDGHDMRISPPPEQLEKLREMLHGIAVPESMGKTVEKMDSDNVAKHWKKLIARLGDDPEGAITVARNLTESVCKHILDESGVAYEDKWDLQKLYSLTSGLLNLAPSRQTAQIFRQILGGCTTVVEGIAAVRNKLSDAHGKGKGASSPMRRHAELAANLASSMAVFLIATWEARKSQEPK